MNKRKDVDEYGIVWEGEGDRELRMHKGERREWGRNRRRGKEGGMRMIERVWIRKGQLR